MPLNSAFAQPDRERQNDDIILRAAMVPPVAAAPARPKDAADIPSAGRDMSHPQAESAGDRPPSSHSNSMASSSSYPSTSARHASLASGSSATCNAHPPPQHPHHHHHHHSRHISHHEEARMRELDGDILELGIDQPGTPILTAAGLHVPPVVPEGPGGDRSDHSNPISPNRLPLLPESAAVTLGVG